MTNQPSRSARLQLSWHGRSSVGCVRGNNEDSLAAVQLGRPGSELAEADPGPDWHGAADLERPGVLLLVADGMGGAKAGEIASGMAVSIIPEEMVHRAEEGIAPDAQIGDLHRAFVASVHLANERIRDEGASNPQRSGMGTTLTAMWVFDSRALLVHVGDSRAYLFRGGNLAQVTKDQSLVEKLLEDNIISPEEAEKMSGRNIILQALGSEDDLDVDHPEIKLQPGDTLMLCTDGLTTVLNNGRVEEAMRLGGGLQAMCERLITLAEDGGGPDNITVLLAQVEPAHKR